MPSQYPAHLYLLPDSREFFYNDYRNPDGGGVAADKIYQYNFQVAEETIFVLEFIRLILVAWKNADTAWPTNYVVSMDYFAAGAQACGESESVNIYRYKRITAGVGVDNQVCWDRPVTYGPGAGFTIKLQVTEQGNNDDIAVRWHLFGRLAKDKSGLYNTGNFQKPTIAGVSIKKEIEIK